MPERVRHWQTRYYRRYMKQGQHCRQVTYMAAVGATGRAAPFLREHFERCFSHEHTCQIVRMPNFVRVKECVICRFLITIVDATIRATGGVAFLLPPRPSTQSFGVSLIGQRFGEGPVPTLAFKRECFFVGLLFLLA